MPCDLLAIGAHPDDVELMCGGSVAKAARAGRVVGLLDLTRGELGSRGDPETRRAESLEAARILGAAFREALDLGDGGLRTGREEELLLAAKIREHHPRIVLAPFREARHPDHARAGRLVSDASFLAGLAKLGVPGPPHRPDRVVYYMERYLFLPSFVVDVSEVWETKMAAIRAFGSQFHREGSSEPRTHLSRPEFLGEIDARGRFFGSQVGVRYGEAFFSEIAPKVDDLFAAFRGLEPSFNPVEDAIPE